MNLNMYVELMSEFYPFYDNGNSGNNIFPELTGHVSVMTTVCGDICYKSHLI